ncbi:hypothetical protein IQ16_07765 [Bradyrhizobium huanghuaihaiense]|uniref:Uncharacterized protein n=1 Tax=Bradyrhizobium huanghuaihaiense TaxID=990078 RepID=A0A562QU53_9BRAD|nr:hypothetical protein [Bradyrhizobium huanghuaihaiense]TWI60267.1 hypothetical protein IQ16_07765 [Bradyrhizobium huanghuaihaiense]
MVAIPATQAEKPYHFIGIVGLAIAAALLWLSYLGFIAPGAVVNQAASQQIPASDVPTTQRQAAPERNRGDLGTK